MIYHVIGVMSGSSLDGLDIAYVEWTEVRGEWSFQLHAEDCITFPEGLKQQLVQAPQMRVPEIARLNTALGRFIGESVNGFIAQNKLEHKIHFIASHGHTVWHEPQSQTTYQIGCGAQIAAVTHLPAIVDLRSADVAYQGQGAPIVPIADRFAFSDYAFCLNLGGIGNITFQHNHVVTAFDICPVNQVLNHFAQKLGSDFDKDGALASQGQVNEAVLQQLNALPYYQQTGAKSLANQFSEEQIIPLFSDTVSPNDALATYVSHIVEQIKNAIVQILPKQNELLQLLATGGGAFNTYLIQQLSSALAPLNIHVHVPDEKIVEQKEAIAMALIGILRWREEENVLASVTGALHNSINGAIYLPTIVHEEY